MKAPDADRKAPRTRCAAGAGSLLLCAVRRWAAQAAAPNAKVPLHSTLKMVYAIGKYTRRTGRPAGIFDNKGEKLCCI